MQSLDLSKFETVELPKFLKVSQAFDRERIEDIPGEVTRKMEPYLSGLTGKRIAVGVGSRGVANIALLSKTVVDNLKKVGAIPFVIPVMGSHGGATPEGQAEVLGSFGITAETMGCEIDPSVDVEVIGEYEPGLPIYVCKSALESDGIVLIPRIKPHTCFRGKVESGICKMLVIGLGKQVGADSVHRQGFHRFAELIPGVGRMIVERTKFLFAVSVLENAYEDTCQIEVVSKADVLKLEREIALLEVAKEKMAKILIDEFDVLVMEQIGKNISGDGQDPNVTGLYFTKCASGGPEFKKSVIFDVTDESHGNANGVGVADVTTRRLFDKIDFIKMYTNCFTSTEGYPVKIPMVAATPEDALRIAIKMCNGVKPGQHKIVWIKNTLELTEMIISEPLLERIQSNARINVLTEATDMIFNNGEPVYPW